MAFSNHTLGVEGSGGGGELQRPSYEEVKEAIYKARDFLASSQFKKLYVEIVSHIKSSEKIIGEAKTLRLVETFIQPLSKIVFSRESEIKSYIYKSKLIFAEKKEERCLETESGFSDASVSGYHFGADICFDVRKLSLALRSTLWSSVVALWVHELFHLNGNKDETIAHNISDLLQGFLLFGSLNEGKKIYTYINFLEKVRRNLESVLSEEDKLNERAKTVITKMSVKLEVVRELSELLEIRDENGLPFKGLSDSNSFKMDEKILKDPLRWKKHVQWVVKQIVIVIRGLRGEHGEKGEDWLSTVVFNLDPSISAEKVELAVNDIRETVHNLELELEDGEVWLSELAVVGGGKSTPRLEGELRKSLFGNFVDLKIVGNASVQKLDGSKNGYCAQKWELVLDLSESSWMITALYNQIRVEACLRSDGKFEGIGYARKSSVFSQMPAFNRMAKSFLQRQLKSLVAGFEKNLASR